jgi:hypothetical protein
MPHPPYACQAPARTRYTTAAQLTSTYAALDRTHAAATALYRCLKDVVDAVLESPPPVTDDAHAGHLQLTRRHALRALDAYGEIAGGRET